MTGHTPHNVHTDSADSADFIRALGPVTKQGLALSQRDASKIREGIAAAIGISDAELARQLSKAQRAKSQADIDAETTRLIQAMQSH
ncbi:hypothetical protein N5C43_08745 [Comamonas terrigena]|uniref:hypothetical protein n=1 Tax=Comamonas terrigena TaxID=32013 RepID=UPI00244BA55E|nr:hypothetical protein [Comamonas terrigena]MDH1291346.1 hypothetical protein [Comamonas terrigena]